MNCALKFKEGEGGVFILDRGGGLDADLN